MSKLYKNLIVVILLSIALGIYFLVFEFYTDKKDENFAQQIDCQNYAQKNGFTGIQSNDGKVGVFHEFTYSHKLNTCLMYTYEYDTDLNPPLYNKNVTDMLHNNKTLILYTSEAKGCIPGQGTEFFGMKGLCESDFDKQKTELFND